MPEFHYIPNRLIRAVLITPVRDHPDQWSTIPHILCKACFCQEYEVEEDSLSHVTTEPQDDLIYEKFQAIVLPGICARCQKPY